MLRSLFLLVVLMPALGVHAQSLWSDASAGEASSVSGERRIIPDRSRILSLDLKAMRSLMDQAPAGTLQEVGGGTAVIDLPRPDGGMASFRFLEVPVLHPDLQARYPTIRTFTGVGVEDPSVRVKFDLTPHGFHAMVLGDSGEDWFIDPLVQGNAVLHQVYFKKDFTKQLPVGFSFCSYEQENDIASAQKLTREWMAQRAAERVGDCQLRTYRLALACTGEYANYHGSNTTNNDKSFALAAMATTMNRVNGVYERDATLTMVIVPNNDLLVYLDGATDPYTNASGSTMLGENQATCNAVIGSANYDIGHVFSTGGGGIASLNSPCTSNKARGVTGQGNPIGDPFDIDYVAHEMGHQYGGNHTQNNNCNRAASAAVEVGSGITIMGYAGICSPNVASNSIAMFGGYSMQEMAANITVGNSSTCPVTTPLVNQPPTANAGPDRTIPASTPFMLTGTASDPNGTASLTYSWEQMDNAVATQPPQPTNIGGPAWLPLLPQNTPVRYMPNLPAVIANTSPTWEVLSSVTRDYTFRFTVRDNAPGAGCNDQDDMTVNVDGNSGPFLVTQPNTSLSWPALSNQTVTWDVAGTNGAPVSCSAVDILLSLDGGLTYPTTLASATPNDGSQTVVIPNVQSTTARVMVRANGNIFYDISNTDFTIAAPTSPDYTLAVTSAAGSACQPSTAAYTVQVGSILGYTDPVVLGTIGLPAGLSVTFGTNPVIPVGSTTLTIGSTNAVPPGTYNFTLTASSTSGPKNLALTLEVFAPPGQVVLASPADGAFAVAPGSLLTWNADPNAATYDIQVATDPGMVNIVESGSGITGTSYQTNSAIQPQTTYYWRVQAVNPCGFGGPSPVWSFTTDACVGVTVRIVLDRYGAETTWTIEDGGGTVFASGGPYTNATASGQYPQPDVNVCLPAGCYVLIVNDSFGDGMCCGFGNGFVGVQDGGAIPLAKTGVFASSTSIPFCVPGTCISTLPYSEDLDGGVGAWVQGFEDDIDWTLLSGATPSANTGPTGDHTSGNGNYLYVEATNPNFPSKLAELYGPCIDLGGLSSAQVSFWYHLWGADMGTLSLDVWSGGSWNNDVWTLSGDQGNSWLQATVSLTAYVGGAVRLRFRGLTGAGFTSDMAIDDINVSGTSEVQLAVKGWLEGPYEDGLGAMADELRTAGLLPLSEPYSALGYPHVGGGGESTSAGVLAVSGGDAIVDWVVVELRDDAVPTSVLATRSGLLQRDGDVVGMDGASPLTFPLPPGSYHVALRHRNHLGCMTANAIALDADITVVDLRLPATATFGTEARKVVGNTRVLWAGNVVWDDELKYAGTANDRDPILTVIGGTVPTATVSGYLPEDVNLDGQARYTGAANDRDIILQNIGGVVPTATRSEQLP